MEADTNRSLAEIVSELQLQSLGSEIMLDTLQGFNPILNSSVAQSNVYDLSAFIDIMSTVIFNIDDGIRDLIGVIRGDRLQVEENRRELIDTLRSLSFGPLPPPRGGRSSSEDNDDTSLASKFISFLGFGAAASSLLRGIQTIGKIFPILKSFNIDKILKVISEIPLIGKPFVSKIEPLIKFISKFGKLVTKFGKFIPLLGEILLIVTGIIATVTGAIEGYKTGGILGAISGGLSGLLVDIVGSILDVCKDISSWIAKQLGFAKYAAFLDSFTFSSIIGDTVKFLVNVAAVVGSILGGLVQWFTAVATPLINDIVQGLSPLKEDFNWLISMTSKAFALIGNLFVSAGDALMIALKFLGLDKLATAWIIDPVKELFNRAGEWISDMFTSALDTVKGTFSDTSTLEDYYKKILRGSLPDPRDHTSIRDPFYHITRLIPKSVYDYAGMDITGDSPTAALAAAVKSNTDTKAAGDDLTTYRRSLMSDAEFAKLSREDKMAIGEDYKSLKNNQPLAGVNKDLKRGVYDYTRLTTVDTPKIDILNTNNIDPKDLKIISQDDIQPIPSGSGSTLSTVKTANSHPIIINNMGGNVTNTNSSQVNNNSSPFEPIMTGSSMGFASL